MHTHTRIPALLLALLLCLPSIGHGQSQVPDQPRQVDFAHSCSAAVQGRLQRGVAMLHSFWFSESEKTFREVLAQEPACVIATWGIAAALMANPLAGHGPSPQEAQRERDYLDAVAAYYQAWETRPEPARQQSRAQAFIECGDWRQAMTLAPPGSHVRFAEALTYFARALGAARSGAPEAATRAVHQIEGLRDAITRTHNDDWTAEAEVTHLSAAAWATWAQGQPEEALRLMRRAADLEDERQFMTPGRLVPARELLGELLLALQRPAEALTAFAASQKRAPERFRGLYGAAQAAAPGGDMSQAQRYFGRLVEIAGQGDGRPELAQARAFLAAHPRFKEPAMRLFPVR